MKIRSGFVSNSSSSSFIVAFPKKPTTQNEISEMMFPKDPHGSISNPWPGLDEYKDGLEHTRIVEQVFSDLQTQKKKVSTKELVGELSSRYFVMDGKLYYEGAPYYALDKELAQQYIDLHEQYEAQRRDFDTFEDELLKKHLGPPVQYASKGSNNWKTKKPYTDEEIKAYEDYFRKETEFKETNAEFVAAQEKHNKAGHKYYDGQQKLADKLANVDLKTFENDNTGTFLARFKYSDNDGEFFSMMEHGGIFDNLHHITISHH